MCMSTADFTAAKIERERHFLRPLPAPPEDGTELLLSLSLRGMAVVYHAQGKCVYEMRVPSKYHGSVFVQLL
ncbi:hypothetical protein N7475_010499 [Penicillium sp. IBT 31633x]|nr:hypothetical protein N7475_010499 [Penicillium sp. IBT 31633x]